MTVGTLENWGRYLTECKLCQKKDLALTEIKRIKGQIKAKDELITKEETARETTEHRRVEALLAEEARLAEEKLDGNNEMNRINLRELAIAHRLSIRGFIWGSIGTVASLFISGYLIFAVISFLIFFEWKLAKAAHYGAFASAIALLSMLIPVTNVLVLVLMCNSAARKLKQGGLRVDAMGVKDCNLPKSYNIAS